MRRAALVATLLPVALVLNGAALPAVALPAVALRAVALPAVALPAVALPAVGLPARATSVFAAGNRIEQEPTADEVAASQRRADDLHTQLQQSTDTLGQARARLAEAAQRAGAALQAYRNAVLARQNAQLAQLQAEQALLAAQLHLADQQAALGRWARQAYASGTALDDYAAVATLLDGGSTDDVGTALAWLNRVGRSESLTVDAVVRAQQDQQAATERARSVAAQAATAEQAAQNDEAARTVAVAAQQQQVDALAAVLRTTASQAAEADLQVATLTQARIVAQQWSRQRSANSAGPDGNAVTGPVGSCAGGDTSQYANGQIPLDALCPVYGAPGELLRADAAYAFNRLSQAYQAAFGVPICVTDSYRSYDDQVRVYAEKPDLAAHPGTSNHGWGTATDLCGGIESFDSPTHAWMLTNAPLFGWFHPAWAEPGGSKPEPWHWEFGG